MGSPSAAVHTVWLLRQGKPYSGSTWKALDMLDFSHPAAPIAGTRGLLSQMSVLSCPQAQVWGHVTL